MQYRGIVQEGKKDGRKLGYPTANISLGGAGPGIYAAKVTVGKDTFNAAVFANQERNLLEAHLLDFEGDLYGQEIAVELLKKIRDAEHFKTEDELLTAIANDIAAVREYFDL